jgi:hypothetical protein
MNNYWKRGQKTALAKKAGIQYPHLWEILNRKRGVGRDRAILLEKASEQILDRPIPFRDWLFNTTTDHRAFYGEPKEGH